jgi:thiamine biosynthesis lipoprotein
MKKVNPYKWIAGFLFVSIILGTLILRRERAMVILQGKTMGTTYTVKYVQESGAPTANQISVDIEALLKEVNRQMSTWQKDSEISTFNQSQAGKYSVLSEDFLKVLLHAMDVAKETDGVFDPTIGPLVNIWGFGPDGKRKVPSKEEIAQASAKVGYDKLEVIPETREVRKTVEGMYLDLSASAKGFGVDVISDHLQRQGLVNHMVEIGGEVRTLGTKNGKDWSIGIEVPSTDSMKVAQKVLPLKDRAIATSGSYRNFFEKGKKKYSHAMNFKTGEPIQHTLVSVSVILDSCMEADSWATALMVLGVDKGLQLAEKLKIPAYFIYSPSGQNESRFVEKSTTAFTQLFGSP